MRVFSVAISSSICRAVRLRFAQESFTPPPQPSQPQVPWITWLGESGVRKKVLSMRESLALRAMPCLCFCCCCCFLFIFVLFCLFVRSFCCKNVKGNLRKLHYAGQYTQLAHISPFLYYATYNSVHKFLSSARRI